MSKYYIFPVVHVKKGGERVSVVRHFSHRYKYPNIIAILGLSGCGNNEEYHSEPAKFMEENNCIIVR